MLQTRQDLIHGLELASFILSSRQTKNNTLKIRNTCMQHSRRFDGMEYLTLGVTRIPDT